MRSFHCSFFKFEYIPDGDRGQRNMNILTVDNIKKAYGMTRLFDGASFYLQEGEKVGVLGINGAGKSTLLKMIAGEEQPDEGNIIRASGMVIAYLPQTPAYDPEEEILSAAVPQDKAGRQEWERQELLVEAKAMLTGLGVRNFEGCCGTLSGGEIKRLFLVRTLLQKPDLLILDEPTNHLDQEMADYLEDTLRRFRGSLIMVTHDRYFLDSVCGRIIEVERGQIYSYEANYAGYLELKSQRIRGMEAADRKRHSILRTELQWVQRGARARTTKQKARLQRFELLSSMEDTAQENSVRLSSVSSRMGNTTIELKNISKSFGNKILIRDFSYLFLKNDRVAFMGRNGCGKTTLMKMILGLEKPDSGEIGIGQTIRIGCFAQLLPEDMDPSMRVIDYIREQAEYIRTEEGLVSAARLLEEFLFEGEDQYGLIGKLSGGQKRRLYLCRVLMGAPNVLILDEPTNDLDITTLRVLEDYLDRFNGIVIMVSHDRYFLDRCARRLFVFRENGELFRSEGGYTDYRNRMRLQQEEEASEETSRGADAEKASGMNRPGRTDIGTEAGSSSGRKNTQSRKKKFSFKEQRDYETIEEEVSKLEEKMKELDEQVLANATDFVRLRELEEEKQKVSALLEEKMERWMYLEELAEEIRSGQETAKT